MVFKSFLCVFITTSSITPYSVVFVIYNAIYSGLDELFSMFFNKFDRLFKGILAIGVV